MISKGLEEINPNDYYKTKTVWSDYMKEFRQSTGLSQKKFAEYFNLPYRTLQDWELGRHNPPPYLLDLLKRIWKLENH